MSIRPAFLLPLLFATARLAGQEIKLAGVELAGYPKADLITYPGTGIGYNEVGGFITVPLVSKDSADILVNQVRYRQLNTALYNSELYTAERVRQQYYQVSWAFNWIHRFNADWLLVTSVTPTLASDLEGGANWSDLLVQGAVLLRRTAHPRWKYGAGLSYNTAFGRPLIMPVVEVSYRKLPWTMNALLPASVQGMYHRPNDVWRAGFSIALDGNYFKLGIGDPLPGSTLPTTHAEYTRVNIGPVFDLRLHGQVRLELTGGLVTNRLLRFVNADATVADLKATAGPFARATIAYVIKLPGS